MNQEIYNITERLKDELSNPDADTISSVKRDFVYNGIKYQVTFYKVSGDGGVSFFFICNPFHIVPYVSNQIL